MNFYQSVKVQECLRNRQYIFIAMEHVDILQKTYFRRYTERARGHIAEFFPAKDRAFAHFKRRQAAGWDRRGMETMHKRRRKKGCIGMQASRLGLLVFHEVTVAFSLPPPHFPPFSFLQKPTATRKITEPVISAGLALTNCPRYSRRLIAIDKSIDYHCDFIVPERAPLGYHAINCRFTFCD